MTDVNTETAIGGLGARVHLFMRPERREAFAAMFAGVLGCPIIERDIGLALPIALVRFEDGSSFSVEFTPLAPDHDLGREGDEAAFRGAWIEFRARQPDRLEAALRRSGTPEFRHPGSPFAYFSAPGGQVFRIVDVAESRPAAARP